jgi:tetratricopeptide (TPR) repeat protein
MKLFLRSGLKLNKQIIILLLIFLIGAAYTDLFSQNNLSKPTRQSSLEAFSKGNYEQAFNEFRELLLTYSKDPLYKYYSGVCLVKLNKKPSDAVDFLQQALNGAGVVRSLPADALFYLGRAQQMSGKFTEAVGTYNLFTEQAGKKASRELGVPEFINQCNERRGAVAEAEIKKDQIIIHDTATVRKKDILPVKPEKIVQEKVYTTENYENILDEALKFQFKADSLNALVAQMKKELLIIPDNQKPFLKEKISGNELLASTLQKSADQKYSEANAVMNPKKEKIIQKDSVKLADVMNSGVVKTYVTTEVKKDSVKPADNKDIKIADNQADAKQVIIQTIQKPVNTFAFFDVIDKPLTDTGEKIQINSEVPAGLIYRIQIAVFRNPVSTSYFKGITPVYGFKVQGTDKTNYYAGMFRKSSDASKALAIVKSKGFKDAFVVSFSGNKAVSSDRALVMEKEWGKKPFVNVDANISETVRDTVPPTLAFRVEVMKSAKPVKEDIMDGMKKMSGSRGLDILQLENGSTAYLIGKFITFESASEYAGLLIRNGYPEAHVVAFLGNKEISVETAKQLFDNL